LRRRVRLDRLRESSLAKTLFRPSEQAPNFWDGHRGSEANAAIQGATRFARDDDRRATETQSGLGRLAWRKNPVGFERKKHRIEKAL
jgi:hypothetical protein